MPINTKHPAFVAHEAQWQRCRDVVDGSDAVKDRGETYLPKLGGQTNEAYTAYKMRAYWFGAAARTLQGLTGAVMRADPITEVPAILDDLVEDVTQQGSPFPAFVKTTLEEVMKTGRYGVLIDMPAQAENPRPYWVAYQAEQIINWEMSMRDGIPILSFVALCEYVLEEDPKDPYVMNSIEQYRELYLDETTDPNTKKVTYSYYQQLWRKKKTNDGTKEEWMRQGTPIIPLFRESPLDFIPFCFFGPTTVTPMVEKSPILDLADANLSHYRSSADLEHGRHFCGLPTPWIAGFPENTHLEIGSSVAWCANDPNAKAGMLEFTGQGLGALEQAIKEKKEDMAVLGARLLEAIRPSVEAAETLQTRLSGEQSILQSVANTMSVGFSKLLTWSAYWLGVSDASNNCTAKVNSELIDTKISFTELTELVKAWQSGAISYDTMYYNMERGGVTRPGIDSTEEQATIEVQKPTMVPQNIDPTTGLPMNNFNADGSPNNGVPTKKPVGAAA